MSPKRLAHFSVLLILVILTACTVTSFTGTTSVAVGQQATYDISVQGSGAGTAEVYMDVPVGWTVSSATWTATIKGQDATGTASTAPSTLDSTCNGAPAAGYQRIRFSANFPNGSSSDSGTLHVVFNVGGSAGTYTLQAFGAGIAQGSSSETCTDTTPHTLQVTVVGTSVTKAFSPSIISAGDTSMLTVTLSNPGSTPATNPSFVDVYPNGIVNAPVPNASSTCGGTVTADPGFDFLQFSGGTIPAGGTCKVTTLVRAKNAGTFTNTIVAGAVLTSNGSNGVAASATLQVNVIAHPEVAKSFSPSTVSLGGNSTLTITLTNPNPDTATAVAFTDALPSGMVIASTPNTTTTCGGTVTASPGSNTLQLNGAQIPGSDRSCTVTTSVTTTAGGALTNTIPAGGLTTSVGSNNVAASATLTSIAPPSVRKAFSPATIATKTNSMLTITLTNPNATALTGAAFTDIYPNGVVNASSPNAGSTCGGTVTAAPNGNSVALANGTIPANGSCTVTVSLTTSSAGTYQNTIPAGGVTTSSSGANATPASATLIATPFNAIPALDERALAALAAVLAVMGGLFVRRS
jgi:uncharacterized repeat protein (TIGR01451 family)